MTPEESYGFQVVKGAGKCVSKWLVDIALILLIIFVFLNLSRNYFGWGLDDSDENGWKRSGLIVHKDYKTGVEYLSDGKGGLVRRDSK